MRATKLQCYIYIIISQFTKMNERFLIVIIYSNRMYRLCQAVNLCVFNSLLEIALQLKKYIKMFNIDLLTTGEDWVCRHRMQHSTVELPS